MTSINLPADDERQVYVTVSAIVAGTLFLPHEEVFQDCVRDEPAESDNPPQGTRVPSFAFLIQHPKHGKLLFDLGLRKKGEGYPPLVQDAIPTFRSECDEDVVDKIAKAEPPIEPQDISIVIYSHLHFDHIGDLTPFSRATLVMGKESEVFLRNPYPDDLRGTHNALPAGQRVCYLDFTSQDASPAQDMPHSRLIQPMGSFDRAIDLFGDGSLYLVDAPGHMSGHMVALARIASNAFVLLAADTCHSRQCYVPSSAGMVREISSLNYQQWDVAKATVTKLMEMSQQANVVVVLAHEVERLQENCEEDRMPLFPESLNAWASQQLEKKFGK
ncbi:hypothetical protein K503DRAFT_313850 [Rhizopogon vinicolor AM-OR11-026]|uniref:Metallo-beta-lactamase domain-containing protein n=1 Tax=Rhizopogon vinicolor AM-OR11-026 TaxID=1314800 RepID=A0A1B7MUJ9_9AGAM|nr:hypothetical protein K503DRAFT_313850 [Rhizopogon vinicolor AM-OR11-026]